MALFFGKANVPTNGSKEPEWTEGLVKESAGLERQLFLAVPAWQFSTPRADRLAMQERFAFNRGHSLLP